MLNLLKSYGCDINDEMIRKANSSVYKNNIGKDLIWNKLAAIFDVEILEIYKYLLCEKNYFFL